MFIDNLFPELVLQISYEMRVNGRAGRKMFNQEVELYCSSFLCFNYSRRNKHFECLLTLPLGESLGLVCRSAGVSSSQNFPSLKGHVQTFCSTQDNEDVNDENYKNAQPRCFAELVYVLTASNVQHQQYNIIFIFSYILHVDVKRSRVIRFRVF